MNKNNLPNNLYILRKNAALSQEEFAERLGVSRQAVSKWERGEAYPDTENLIAISEMFSVTLDELVKSENIDGGADECKNDCETDTDDESEDNGGYFRVNMGDKVKVNLNGQITVDDEDTKVKIDFDKGDIIVNDEDGQVKVGLGNGGITVDSDDGVKIQLGKRGIVIHDNSNDDEDDDADEDCPKGPVASVFYAIPYPIITLVAFFALGLFLNAWYWAWTLFLTIPIYYPLISAIRRKRFSVFPYPIFITFLFCLLGMLYGIWHPMWIIYLTIPLYYPIASAIDRKINK